MYIQETKFPKIEPRRHRKPEQTENDGNDSNSNHLKKKKRPFFIENDMMLNPKHLKRS